MTSPGHYDLPASDVPAARQARRHDSCAASFRPDPAMEAAEQLHRIDPAAVPATTKIGLAYYVAARAAAEDTR